jgi:hypothetical protein
MNVRRLAGAGMLGAMALGVLGGCEVQKHLGARCATTPPVPHQEFGYIYVDVEVPPEVEAGSTFTVRIDHMGAYPGPPPPYGHGAGEYPTGTLSVSGPVTPSGTFRVGHNLISGTPYPNTLELTATGDPGETIRLGAVGGGSAQGVLPDRAFHLSCNSSDQEIVTIPIVASPS